MLIKVCGIRENEDLISVSKLGIEYAGFVFTPTSPRDAAGILDTGLTELLGRSVPNLRKTGVFADADESEINDMIDTFHLAAVQLQGEESPELCAALKERVEVIKAFPVVSAESFGPVAAYEGTCTFFLFDAPAGENGYSFDWSLLTAYDGNTPFFLGGGIGPQDAIRVLEISHPQFAGIDIGSKFELYPGKKDIPRLAAFVHAFKPVKNGLYGF
jgi:phosphoribosylanthranilate isomerase